VPQNRRFAPRKLIDGDQLLAQYRGKMSGGAREDGPCSVVILAGGLGTRLAEETEVKPKPMVEIGGRPILWHILKHYAHHGFTDIYIALGYRGEVIKRYFVDYYKLDGSMTVRLATGAVERSEPPRENWCIHLVDTGAGTGTGGRLHRLKPFLDQRTFMVTYGDGVADVDLKKLLAFHRRSGRAATVTAVRPPARFGALVFDGDRVAEFQEKPQAGEGWINGGYLVLEPKVFDYLPGDDASLENHALQRLAQEGQLGAFRHDGFWQCMDTLRDKRQLDQAWESGQAPWKVWS
jgi:glucose-1-phosphate cytidylyltransferase